MPGLRYFPAYRNQSEEDFLRLVGFPTSGLPAPEGLLPQHSNLSQVWRLLDARFDGLVGNCECMGDRDMPDVAFTVHFSCMAVFSKPGHFSSDRDFQTVVYNRGKSCTRFYYMHWYNAYRSMMGPLPEPLYDGPPVPIWNKTHDGACARAASCCKGAREHASERASEPGASVEVEPADARVRARARANRPAPLPIPHPSLGARRPLGRALPHAHARGAGRRQRGQRVRRGGRAPLACRTGPFTALSKPPARARASARARRPSQHGRCERRRRPAGAAVQ